MDGKAVRDIMHKGVIVCRPDTPLEEVVRITVDADVHRLLVTEMTPTGKKPVGVVSTTDIVKDMRGTRWVWCMG